MIINIQFIVNTFDQINKFDDLDALHHLVVEGNRADRLRAVAWLAGQRSLAPPVRRCGSPQSGRGSNRRRC